MILKSLFQVFNPTVETGPGRLIARHPYADGFMPDYRAADCCGDDDVPTAVYANYGGRGPEYPVRTRAAAIGRDCREARGGDQSPTDFIVSLLKTIQLTPRAVLKKKARSSSKSATPHRH